MKQLQECPLCKGHGLLRVDTQQRWWYKKLGLIRWISEKLRKLTTAEEP